MFGVVIVVVGVVLLVFAFRVFFIIDDGFIAAIHPAPHLPAQRFRHVAGERLIYGVHVTRHGAASAHHLNFDAVDPVGQAAGVNFMVADVKALNADKLPVTTNTGLARRGEIDHHRRQRERVIAFAGVGLVAHGNAVDFTAGNPADARQRLHRPAVQHACGVAHPLIVALPHNRVHLGIAAALVDVARAIDQHMIDAH